MPQKMDPRDKSMGSYELFAWRDKPCNLCGGLCISPEVNERIAVRLAGRSL